MLLVPWEPRAQMSPLDRGTWAARGLYNIWKDREPRDLALVLANLEEGKK